MAAAQLAVLLLGAAFFAPAIAAEPESVKIGVKHRPEKCETKAKNGDYVGVHYIGKLTDGTEFDNSYKRSEPIEFQLGYGQVIAGWEQGILGMCPGEKRRLHIPPHLGYGDGGMGPIPGGATLVFDVELSYIASEPQQSGSDGYPGGYGAGYGEDEEDYPQLLGEEAGYGFGHQEEASGEELNFGDMRGYGYDDEDTAEMDQ
ncbi:hypothetical protein Agub_g7176 [Astrephomene gubernaculifera]|uniref:peptidylprolyl isomerase n=1 Tax=Astrephomene gubernaculifera TaxID=47775 RepID=A0AAD3DPP3_9CHLO|nr:hypothetical protein Agub_g7176 [Astrephomene gubernaculifera]